MTTISYENLKLLNQPFEDAFRRKFDVFLKNGWYILGQEVAAFETEFAAYHNEKYAIGVANGLDALILSLKCSGLKPGKEVIVPSNTYIATILAVVQCGLVPVLVEPDLGTYNIDPEKIKAAITSETGAIMVVHLYGRCCDMDAVMEIAQENGLKVIEDCAQAHGARYKGRKAGTFGDFGAFSFYPTKNLGALGDGGAVICKTEEDFHTVRQLRNYGSDKKYYNEIVGYNSRLDELQAAFLRIKLPDLNRINTHKRRLAELYHNYLDPAYIKPLRSDEYDHVYHIFNIRLPERDRLKTFLSDGGIGTEIHYPLSPHRQQALKRMFMGLEFPISDEIHQTTLSLPCSFIHTDEQIYRVIERLNRFL